MIRRLLFLAIVCNTLPLFAQESVIVSPVVSFNFGSPLFINRSSGTSFIGSGSGNSFSLGYGMGMKAEFPQIIGPFDLIGRLQYRYTNGQFAFTPPSPSDTIRGIDRAFLLEVSAGWNSGLFQLRVGPWVSESISGNVWENDPNGIPITITNAESSPTHAGIAAGVGLKVGKFIPELNGFVDLTQVGNAGVNALSAGVSLLYHFSSTNSDTVAYVAEVVTPVPTRRDFRRTPMVSPHLNFMVNQSELIHWVPVERMETRVKEYAMVDSDHAAPRTSQWVLESYHLPHIAIACEIDRDAGAELELTSDTISIARFTFSQRVVPGLTFDTVLDLTTAPEWQSGVSKLNVNVANTINATLRSTDPQGYSMISHGTLFLPPVDTTHITQTTVKKEFRFLFSERYRDFKDEGSYLDLLLDRVKELMQNPEHAVITMRENPMDRSESHELLVRQLRKIIGTAISTVSDAGIQQGVLLTFDY